MHGSDMYSAFFLRDNFGAPRRKKKDNINVKLGKACTGLICVRTRADLGHL
jgi:hypothetical protein